MNSATAARGYALVVVLWSLVLLSTVTASYHASARTEAKLLRQSLYRAQAQALAEAGMWIALREHQQSGQAAARRAASLERSVELDGAIIDVSIRDAAGKINLNVANAELIDALLAGADMLQAERAALVGAIVDWRDADNLRAAGGAEDEDYRRAGLGYESKDAPFATVDELRYVRGMTPALWQRISPSLTVHGTHSRVNPAAASASLLEILAADADATAGAQRSRGDTFVATARATAGGITAQISATIRYARGANDPIQILAWGSDGD